MFRWIRKTVAPTRRAGRRLARVQMSDCCWRSSQCTIRVSRFRSSASSHSPMYSRVEN